MDQSKLLNVAYADRSAYDILAKHGFNDTMQGTAKLLWEEIEEFYARDNAASCCDGEVLIGRATRKNEKLGSALATIVGDFKPELSVPNLTQEILEAKRHHVGLELASLLTAPNPNKQAISELIEKYDELSVGTTANDEADAEIFMADDYDDLVTARDPKNLFQLFPKVLNDHVDGGVVPQSSIAVFARPEVGKSMVVINMAYGFARTGKRVLIVGNEDPHREYRTRIISRFTGLRKLEVWKDVPAAITQAKEKGFGNIIFASISPGTPKAVEKLILKYKPQVLIVDQVRNIEVRGDGLTVTLERVAKLFRDMGKKHDLVTVQVTQAGDSATGKLVLGYNDVDSSKTGFPAAFDIMIGVGMNDAYRQEGKRMFTLCKNKTNDDHAYFPVRVDPTISKVVSI